MTLKKILGVIKDYSLLFGLLTICFVAFIYAVLLTNWKSNFKDATYDEQRQIEEFYSIEPEMISYGKVFDMKFVVPSSVMNRDGLAGDPHIQSRMYISVLKKTVLNVEYSIDIDCYSNNEKINVSFLRFDKYDFSVIPGGYYFGGGSDWFIENKYFIPMYPLIVLNANVEKPTVIDRVVITIEYFGGSEVHDMTFNVEKSNELIRGIMEASMVDPLETSGYEQYQDLIFYKYMYNLFLLDYDEWEALVISFLDECELGKETIGGYCASNFYFGIYPLYEYEKNMITDEQWETYSKLMERYKMLDC